MKQHLPKRTALHKKDIMSWLNQRHSKTAPQEYRFFPEEIKRQSELEQLFKKFDSDDSNALDFIEVFRMFNKYGFFITKEELMKYFKIVDLNKDYSLNLDEFKACMLDKQAKEQFSQIMKELSRRTLSNQEIEKLALEEMNKFASTELQKSKYPSPVLPFSFQKIINLMTYLNTREELKETLTHKSTTAKDQFKCLQDLVSLSDKIDLSKRAQLQRKIVMPSQQNFVKLQKEMQVIKHQSIQIGLDQAEEALRRKNSAPLIMTRKPKEYKYSNKFQEIPKKLKTTYEPEINDNKVNEFYRYLNVQVPDDLKLINHKIWNQLFSERKNLDDVLKRQRASQMQSQRTDRLRYKIQESLNRLHINLDPTFEATSHHKKQIEVSSRDEPQFPTMPTSRHTFSEDFKSGRTFRV